MPETTLSFDGHRIARTKNLTILSDAELARGDISMEIVSARMGRRYARTDILRRVFQLIFHMVNNSQQVFAIGWIQPDKTVVGGTGWGVELAKFFNRQVSVFDQTANQWFTWKSHDWQEDQPIISTAAFCGTGTRNLTSEGRQAIEDLFARSFR